ncbi:MAG: twin-arginine translocase TatA/TatE family subunit [Flavobacterium sp.]|nr:twin-arginine translocase TatA/TatE family subunit [Flavobacterium sp.]
MFGIGGSEFIFIILIVLMFFGSDKIPEMARGLAKGMAQLKNATNEIKTEITKSVEETGFDPNSLTGGISQEIAKAKEGFSKMVTDSTAVNDVQSGFKQIAGDITSALDDKPTINSQMPNIEAPTEPTPEIPDGPIKRTR